MDMPKKIKLDDIPQYDQVVRAIKRAYYRMDKGKYRLRDLSIIALMTYAGLRVKEILRLRKKDFDIENKTVRVENRVIQVTDNMFWTIITRYLKRFKDLNEHIFPISERGLRYMVYGFCDRFLDKRYRPHSFRHMHNLQTLKYAKNISELKDTLGIDRKTLKKYLKHLENVA